MADISSRLPDTDESDGTVNSTAPTTAIQIGGTDGTSLRAVKTDSTGQVYVNQGTPPWQVVGNIASGATDSGNPIKAGSVYNLTMPTVSDGQRVNLQANRFGELAIVSRNKYQNITGNATTVVKSSAGRLHLITINNPVGSIITIYDNTAGSGIIIATVTVNSGSSAQPFSMAFDVTFNTGLTVVTSGSSNGNITVSYQ